jgi:nucleoid DNA-binding protein
MRDPIIRSDRPSLPLANESGPLAERLAHAGGVKPAFMRKFIKEVIAVIEEGLLRDGEVKIHNFGAFRLSWPKALPGGNAKTGKAAAPADRPQVIFQPSKHLRELVNLSLGSTIPPGSRISLQALLEKHLRLSAPPVAPMFEEPAPEFDIVETFPMTSSSTFVIAEGSAEKEPATEDLKLGEAIPELASDKSPAFTFAETQKEPASTFSKIEEEFEPPRPAVSPRRSSRFAWYASAAAVFLLLLLFLLSGRISEQSESASFFGADTVSTPAKVAEQASLPNGINGTSVEQPKAAEAPSKPSYESAAFFAGGTHRVAVGDNLWRISGTYYRDHYLWPNIYRVNTATILNPDILQIDQSLDVPVLYGPPEKLTAADRRNLAEGYFLLYRYYKENESSLAPYALWAAVQYDAQIKIDRAVELSEDDLAFLQAHGVRRALAER